MMKIIPLVITKDFTRGPSTTEIYHTDLVGFLIQADPGTTFTHLITSHPITMDLHGR